VGKRRFSGDLINVYKYMEGVSKRMELGSFQWGLEPGQEASETNLNTRFPFNIRDFYFYLFLFFNIYLFIYLFIFTV